jgi:nuclear pore complex protein Nup155
LFIEIGVEFPVIVGTLEKMIYNDEAPFSGRNRRFLGADALYAITRWYKDCIRHNRDIFGGAENAAWVSQLLAQIASLGLEGPKVLEAQELRQKIDSYLRVR